MYYNISTMGYYYCVIPYILSALCLVTFYCALQSIHNQINNQIIIIIIVFGSMRVVINYNIILLYC